MIAAFGDLVFNVSAEQVYTFDNMALSASLEAEAQEVIENRPSTYIKGPNLETLSFKITLDSSFGIDVRTEIDRWRNMCNAGIPQTFTLGGVPVSDYQYLLRNVDVEIKNITKDGIITRADITVKMEEYVRPGSPPKDNTKDGGMGFSGIDPAVETALFSIDSSGMRSNPGVDESIAQGLFEDGG